MIFIDFSLENFRFFDKNVDIFSPTKYFSKINVFRIFFENEKIDIFFMIIFLKSISWSRRIDLKWFQSDTGSLKRRKTTKQNV